MPRHFIHRVYIFLVTSSLTKIFFLLLASIHLQEHIILLRFYSCHLGQVQIYMCIIIQLTPMILPVSFCRLICCSHRRSQLQDPLHWVARLLKLILVQHLSLPLWRTLALKFMLIRCLVCPRLGFLLKIRPACSSTRHVLHPLSLCQIRMPGLLPHRNCLCQQDLPHLPRASACGKCSVYLPTIQYKKTQSLF
jgi:hypothetical protein